MINNNQVVGRHTKSLMGQSLSSMDDEIGRALNAKDIRDLRGKPDLSQQQQQQQKGKENEGMSTDISKSTDGTNKNNETTSENTVTAENSNNNNPSMRDKIDNLIEGYLLSGEFNVNAKTTKIKNLTSKSLLKMHEETEQMNEKLREQAERERNKKDNNITETITESQSENKGEGQNDDKVDESMATGESLVKGESVVTGESVAASESVATGESVVTGGSVETGDVKGAKVNDSVSNKNEGEEDVKETDKDNTVVLIESNVDNGENVNKVSKDGEIDVMDITESQNEKVNNSETLTEEQKQSAETTENNNKNIDTPIDNSHDKSCDNNDSSDDFVPLIPSQKKSTTTFQTLIDRVLDSSLNCKSPPLDKTNILEVYDKSSLSCKSLKIGSISEQKSVEIDLTVEKSPVAKVNNGRRSSGANNDDMSLSKTKVVCLKDHIEKVLEKSFQNQMGRKNNQGSDQSKAEDQIPRQEFKLENRLYKVVGHGQGHSNLQTNDKTFNPQELVDSMIDQSKVINKLLLPSATNNESPLTGESTLASLERTASMNFEKNPIQCPSEVAKNDDYMRKYEQKTENMDKLSSDRQNMEKFSSEKQTVVNLSPNSNLLSIQYSTKVKYSGEHNQNVDNSTYRDSYPPPPHQQQASMYEPKVNPDNKSNSSPPGGMYHGRSPGSMISPGQRQTVRSDKSPTMYRNNQGTMGNISADNHGASNTSVQQNQSSGMKTVYPGHHGNISNVHNEYEYPSNMRHAHIGQGRPRSMSFGNEIQHQHSSVKTPYGHTSSVAMNQGHDFHGNNRHDQYGNNRHDYHGNNRHDHHSNNRHDHHGNNRHDHHSNSRHDHAGHVINKHHSNTDHQSGSHGQTISVRDCSCAPCNTNSHYKSHGPTDHHQTRDIHQSSASYQYKESVPQQYPNMSPRRQSNRQTPHGVIQDSKHGVEGGGGGEGPYTPSVSSAMALGPSPPNHYFQQNRLQLQQSQNQYKRPQLIPSSPPIPSSREYSARNNQQAVMLSSGNIHPESRGNMPPGAMVRPNISMIKSGMAPHSPSTKPHHSPISHHTEDRMAGYQNPRIHTQQMSHSDESWNKMRDQFQKDVHKQVQNALNPSTGTAEAVLDLSVKKPQQSVTKPHSEDEPLDLTCKTSSPPFMKQNSLQQQTKGYSEAGPTHIHHLESSVDKFCQNVRPLEEHFHRNDKLSAQFQHRIPSEHGSPKQTYPLQFRAPGSVQPQAHSNTGKMLSQVINTSGQESGGSIRPMPPPLMMVAGYGPPHSQSGGKAGPYLPPAHSQPKQQQQQQQQQQQHPQHSITQTHQLQYQQQQAVARQPSPRQLSTRQPSPQLSQQQYQQNSIQKRQESPGVSNDISNQSRNFSKRSNNVSKHEPIQNIIGIHSANDILYLICRLCGQTYGSPYGFRKHFRNQHGFEPRAEHTIVQTISATKTAMQTPPTLLYQGTQEIMKPNNEEQKHGSGQMTPVTQSGSGGHIEGKTQSFNNVPSQNADSDSPQSMMMAVKQGIDQSVSNAFKNSNNIPSNTLKTDFVKSEPVSDLSKNDDCEEIKFLECHECGQTFQLNDFGSYKRHCRQHGQTKMINTYSDVNKQNEITDVKHSSESADKDSGDDSLSCICKFCNIPFATVSFLNDHLSKVHPEEGKVQIKTEYLKTEVETLEVRSHTSEVECRNVLKSEVDSSENLNQLAVKVLPSSDVLKMPADQMTTAASPDSSEQVLDSKCNIVTSQSSEDVDMKENTSVISTEASDTNTDKNLSIDVKHSDDQDSRNSIDAKSPGNLNNLQRQSSVDSSTHSENADTDKSSDSTNIRYFHKKFKRKGSISVSSEASNSKIPKLSENSVSLSSPCSVKSPSANSSMSNDSELCNTQDGNHKKFDDSADTDLEMPELQPGVDFTEVEDNSKLMVNLKCSPTDGVMMNKSEARHQLPFVWDRITRSQAGKNIKPPTYH